MVNLRKLIVPCNYDSAFQDTVLRDRFVSGLVHESTRKRLLVEKDDITFMRTTEIAYNLETASVQARQMQGKSVSNNSVHRVQQQQSRAHQTSALSHYYRCGGSHPSATCHFRQAECHACGKLGHIARVCRSKSTGHSQPKSQKSGRTHTVEVASSSLSLSLSSADLQTIYTIFPLSPRIKLITVTPKVKGQDLQMELDTGASLSIISDKTFKSVFKDTIRLQPSNISLCTYSGEDLTVLGIADIVTYELQNTTFPERSRLKFVWSQLVVTH